MTDTVENPIHVLVQSMNAVNIWIQKSPDLFTLKQRLDAIVAFRLTPIKTGVLWSPVNITPVDEIGQYCPKFLNQLPKFDQDVLRTQSGQNAGYFIVQNPENNKLFYVFSWDQDNWLIKRSGASLAELMLCKVGEFTPAKPKEEIVPTKQPPEQQL